jgi:lipopolysaccharide/colanic/teichoic acid biosynthesis glycosyltransferase
MYRHLFKRLIDFILAFIALIILSPILIPVMIGLKLTGEHYIFYFQKRIGYKNKPFNMWKFATMLKESPNLPGGLFTTKKDPRILPMGGFLRKTKINEIPQIINILKATIYNVRPGLTGIGSIVFRDEERLLSTTTMSIADFYANHISPYKGELEMWYQQHLSFYTDFMLIFLTAWAIVSPDSNLVYKVFKDLPKRPSELN